MIDKMSQPRNTEKRKSYGLRVYNLFPRLIGPITRWDDHLKRILAMDFDWIYVNPINYAGFSGSLYSIKDFFQINPLFLPENSNIQDWGPFKTLITKCHAYGMKFMMDLVINHVAIDSPLIQEHPEWFYYKWALVDVSSDNAIPIRFFEENETPNMQGLNPSNYKLEKRIASPYAIDPADSRKITIWGDLAEINYNSTSDLGGLLNYWKKYLDFVLKLGIDGFRCDAAYQIPQNVWQELIGYVHKQNPKVIFLAETLGCTLTQCQSAADAGFDYIHSSSKWWDFTAAWCIEQYNSFRHFAPSISFPENHDTVRLAHESNGREDIQKFRYLFAAFFSAGVMIPIGYEFGFKKRLNVVETTPSDWETPSFDISEFISKVNHFKKQYDCLNEDGLITHFNYQDLGVLVIRKKNLADTEHMLMIYNKDWHNVHHVYIYDLRQYLHFDSPICRINLNKEPEIIEQYLIDINLNPNEYILYYQKK